MSIKVPMKPLSALCAAAAGFGVATSAPVSFAQVGVCQELDLPGDTVFGAGAAGLSRHLAQLSAAMTGLPEAERISVFYSDAKGACVDLDSWLGSDPGIATYKYWDDSGNQATCSLEPNELRLGPPGRSNGCSGRSVRGRGPRQ
jgi:hypothetical protein